MKYILLILTLLPLLGNAQTSDTIKIPTIVAKQIIKDLVSGDSSKAELNLCNENVKLLTQKIILKDSVINGHLQKGILYEERILNEQKKFDLQGEWVKQLQTANKKLKVKLLFTKITLGSIITGLTYLYIKK